MSERQEHPVIYLQPWCDKCERASGNGDGRMWFQNDAWGKCDDCDRKFVKYILAPEPLK
jgi:hypothetical protein